MCRPVFSFSKKTEVFSSAGRYQYAGSFPQAFPQAGHALRIRCESFLGGCPEVRISTNLMSLASFTALSDVSNRLSKVSKKLATGLRINSASDDASGLAVSQKMRAQIRGLDRSAKNAQDGISLLQTAEGGIQEITSLLQRMRELSVQGANDVLTSEDRGHIQGEIDELSSQVDAIANQTQFNRKNC
jgi:Flagellin and related hook-associated proteins